MSGNPGRGDFIRLTLQEANDLVRRAADAVEKALRDRHEGAARAEIISQAIAGEMTVNIRID